MQHAPFDILDLKIRVPPHITAKCNGPGATLMASTFLTPHHQKSAAIETGAEKEELHVESSNRGGFMLLLPPKAPAGALILCLAPLFWVVSFHTEDNSKESLEQRAKQGACFYLLVGPWTLPTLAQFQACHTHRHWFTMLLSFASLMLGNVSAVLFCASCPCPWIRMWSLSGAMIAAAIQKLLLVHKGHVVLLMISTASAVVICCLAVVAPFLPSLVMTYRCFQSMAIPMLWLFWQAAIATKAKSPPSHMCDGMLC